MTDQAIDLVIHALREARDAGRGFGVHVAAEVLLSKLLINDARQWRPIREAPVGQFVLITGGTFWWTGNPIKTPWKEIGIGFRSDKGWCSGYCGEDNAQFWHEPTHFMPLPPRPEELP